MCENGAARHELQRALLQLVLLGDTRSAHSLSSSPACPNIVEHSLKFYVGPQGLASAEADMASAFESPIIYQIYSLSSGYAGGCEWITKVK